MGERGEERERGGRERGGQRERERGGKREGGGGGGEGKERERGEGGGTEREGKRARERERVKHFANILLVTINRPFNIVVYRPLDVVCGPLNVVVYRHFCRPLNVVVCGPLNVVCADSSPLNVVCGPLNGVVYGPLNNVVCSCLLFADPSTLLLEDVTITFSHCTTICFVIKRTSYNTSVGTLGINKKYGRLYPSSEKWVDGYQSHENGRW